jgi:hypothetical protein
MHRPPVLINYSNNNINNPPQPADHNNNSSAAGANVPSLTNLSSGLSDLASWAKNKLKHRGSSVIPNPRGSTMLGQGSGGISPTHSRHDSIIDYIGNLDDYIELHNGIVTFPVQLCTRLSELVNHNFTVDLRNNLLYIDSGGSGEDRTNLIVRYAYRISQIKSIERLAENKTRGYMCFSDSEIYASSAHNNYCFQQLPVNFYDSVTREKCYQLLYAVNKNIILLPYATHNNLPMTGSANQSHWLDDSESDNCMKCNSAFTIINRKHHWYNQPTNIRD